MDWTENKFFKQKSSKVLGSHRRIGLKTSFSSKKIPKYRETMDGLERKQAFQGKKCQSTGKLSLDWTENKLFKQKSSRVAGD